MPATLDMFITKHACIIQFVGRSWPTIMAYTPLDSLRFQVTTRWYYSLPLLPMRHPLNLLHVAWVGDHYLISMKLKACRVGTHGLIMTCRPQSDRLCVAVHRHFAVSHIPAPSAEKWGYFQRSSLTWREKQATNISPSQNRGPQDGLLLKVITIVWFRGPLFWETPIRTMTIPKLDS